MKFLERQDLAMIARTALPMVGSALIGMATQLGQSVLMGHSDDPRDLLLLSLYQPIAFLMIAVIESLDVTNQVVVSIKTGAGKPADAAASTRFTAVVGAVAAALVALLVFAAGPWLAELYKVDAPADLVRLLGGMTVAYVPVTVSMVLHSALRGLGRTTESMLLTCAGSAANLGLVVLLMRSGYGVFGIPLANAAVALVTVPVALVLLGRTTPGFLKGRWLAPPPAYGEFLRDVGLPLFISVGLVSVSSSLFNWILADFGPSAVAAFFVSFRVQALLVVPAVAFGSGVAIVVNQLIGAARPGNARAVCLGGTALIALAYVPLVAVLYAFREPVVELIATRVDVRSSAAQLLSILSMSYVFLGPTVAVLTIMEQIGRGFRALLINVGTTVVIAAVAAVGLVFRHDMNVFVWIIAGGNLATFAVVANEMRLLDRKLGVAG